MQIHDFIKQRMMNMGFDPSDIVIEPFVQYFSGNRTILPADNVFYFLYEITDYDHDFVIDATNEVIFSMQFILNGMIPSGIYVFTGDIEIYSMGANLENHFMFYKATPGRLLQQN